MRSTVFLLLLLAAQAAHAMDSAYHQRRVKLGEALHGGVAVIFAEHEPPLEYQDYRQDEDYYYLTGLNEPGGALVVIGAGPAATNRLGPVPAHAYREILFLPMRNLILEKYTGVKTDAATPGAAATLGVDEVMPLANLGGVLGGFLGEDLTTRKNQVWTQQDMRVAASAIGFTGSVLGTDTMPPTHDVRDLIIPLRMVKAQAEIELIRKATDASIQGQLAGMRAIKPGVRERTIAGVEVGTMMAEGCERVSYPSIVGSGINSTTLHYASNSKLMEAGDVVVIDAAGEYQMYASDLTRTMPVDGHFTERQKEIYNIVLGAQKAARDAFVAGKSKMGSIAHRDDPEVTLDKVAYDYINTHGKDMHGQPLGKYFLHTLGHSVGIDVHDPYDYDKPFEIGSVFTIEPGLYIPEEKLGVRIEDTFYVDQQGKLIDFAEKLPHTPEEVEAAMHGK